MPARLGVLLLLLACGSPATALGQQAFPVDAPVITRLFEAWVAPVPSPARLFLQLEGTETYPSDSSCMAIDLKTGYRTMRIAILGRRLCEREPGSFRDDGESVPFRIITLPDSRQLTVTVVHQRDSTVFVLSNDGRGWSVTPTHYGPMVKLPTAIPAMNKGEGVIYCSSRALADACDAYFHIVAIRGRLYRGANMISFLGDYSYAPFQSGTSPADTTVLRRQRLYGVIDSASLGRVIAYTEEFGRTMLAEYDQPSMSFQITTGMGLRYVCRPDCRREDLNGSIDGNSLGVFSSEP
jgi:hypothetical protein